MGHKISFEETFTGEYNDTGNKDYSPNIRGEGKLTDLAAEIATNLKPFEGKKVKFTLSVTVEEIG